MSTTTIRILFCVAVAVLAAAIADPLVEFASNAGVFGPGSFTDHSNLDVLPAICAGGFFIVLLGLFRARATVCAERRSRISRLLQAIDDSIAPAVFLRLLPAIFLLQLAVLFGMETLEQYVVIGHSLGGLVWLGGPLLVTLAVHALSCLGASIAVARAIHTIARTVVRIVHILRAFVTLTVQSLSPFLGLLDALIATHEPPPLACRIGKRAPPLLVR